MAEINVVSSFLTFLRSVVPPLDGISNVELGLLFNLSLLAVAIIVHLVSKIIHNRKNEYWLLDQRSFFELGTENKRLQVDLTNKDKEIKRLTGEIYELEARVDTIEKGSRHYQEKMKDMEEQLEKEKESKRLTEEEKKRKAENLSKMVGEVAELEYQLQGKKDELDAVQTYYEDSKTEVQKLFYALNEEKGNNVKLMSELEQKKSDLKRMVDEKEELNLQLSGMALLLENSEKLKREDTSGQINPSTISFGEIAKLRSELNIMEKNNEKLTTLLDLSANEKAKLEDLTNTLKQEILNKEEEIDRCSADRRGADDRASQLLSLLQQCNGKVEERDKLLSDLREEVEKLKETIEALRGEIRSKEDKCREWDAEVKRWRNDYLKLETSSYAKEKDYLRQIHAMQTLASATPNDGFGFNNTLTSDQEHNRPKSEQNTLLWDQQPIDMDASIHRSMISDDHRPVFHPEKTVKSKSGRGRRSEQAWMMNGMGSVQNSDRQRSRSHGRQRETLLIGQKRSPFFI